MKAVVMAGGAGSRLRPLTIGRPKPMVPLVNKPVMGHALDLLKKHGITEVVVTVQYLAERIQEYFGDGASLGMKIHYALEEVPLGTAGSVKNAAQYLDDTFVVISGDALTDFDLTKIITYHQEKKALATITLYHVPNPLEYGVIITDESGRIKQFLEKPSWGEVISDTVNTGIYVLEPQILDYFEPNVSFDFSKDLFPILLAKGDPMYGFVAEGYWCDVGNLQEYMRASQDLLEDRLQLDPLGTRLRAGVWADGEADIAPDAQLYGPIFLGKGVQIKSRAIVRGPTVIRDYSMIGERAYVDRSIIWRNAYIGEAVELRGAIIGRQCSVKARAVVFEGAVLGDGVTVGEDAVIHPNVKIWPEKAVETGATVKASVIWGAQASRSLFGRYGVTGLVNVDITPEFAAKLGAAFAASLPVGSTVTINRDQDRSSRMLKRGIIGGLPSAGVNVADLRQVPIPVARYFTRVSEAVGGVHVRISPYDRQTIDIRFMDRKGMNLNKNAERDIERIFFREDFRRVYLDEIGLIDYPAQVVERYSSDFTAALNAAAIRQAKFNLVVDYASAPASQVLPKILSDLKCNEIPLNANLDDSKISISSEELQRHIQQLAIICTSLKASMGVRLDVGGERIYLVDDAGQVLRGTTALAAMAVMALRANGGGTIAVPVTQPTMFERLAEQYGGRVLRTKADLYNLMSASTKEGVILAGDGGGNFILPQFQPAVDGLMATAKLLEYLATQKTKLSEVVAGLPPYYVTSRQVSCEWENKGTVMRLLNQQFQEQKIERTDGLKIYLGDEWVLVLPDPDRPVFHVFAEGSSPSSAESLAAKYVRIVESLQH
ncbi:MAG: NTP transferase domain-containing protein [Chloroflexi bacterium]|nr:NTP transferase domain-containing protein [Chloroflexota bacterium]